jgi:malonyl-CoA/methylmalonyl-CoA synthetase
MPSSAPAPIDPLQQLQTLAVADPDRPFLDAPNGRHYGYGAFAALVTRIAGALTFAGVRAEDRVAARIDKSPEAVALYLACLQVGAVFVPLNTGYTLAELDYFIHDADASLVVVSPASVDAVRAKAAGSCRVETLSDDGSGTLMDLTQSLPLASRGTASCDSTQLAALLYTSGTTGRSKGAMLTRGNLASNAAALAHAWHFSSADILLHALPIFHVHGLFVAINTVLAAGASMLFMQRFDADKAVQDLRRATVMMGVPTFYTRLLQQPDLSRESVRNIRLFVSGSAPLLAETHREFLARTGHSILERYGMSETLMNTSNPYDGARVPGSVGPALPGVEVRIADPQNGAPLSDAHGIGMIEVRGPNVFRGYWRMPDKTAAEFRNDGFFITGDLGRIDERGYVHIVGRSKDLIITGGYNVYPIEVETEIDALPGVVESAVIGLPHADLGEGVTALVVPKPGIELSEPEIRRALEQRVAKFKIPKRILFVSDLPRNTMGKVQKSALRERFRDLYSPLSSSPQTSRDRSA